MYQDQWTEIISHFIGIFELKTEEARLRLDFDPFDLADADPQDPADLPRITIDLSSAHDLGGVTARLAYTPDTSPLPALTATPGPREPHAAPDLWDASARSGRRRTRRGHRPALSRLHPPPVPYTLPTLAAPGSNATIVLQTTTLFDQDVIITNAVDAVFVPFAHLDAALESLMTTAQDLGVLDAHPVPPDAAAMAAFAEDMADTVQNTGPHAGATVFHGTDAQRLVVDGAVADSLPAWRDHMPERLSPPDESGPEADPAPDDAPPPAPHQLSTGANTLVNDASLTASWVHAPVKVVMGDSRELDVISQINVASDTNLITGPSGAAARLAGATEMINAAGITTGPAAPATAAMAVSTNDWPENWLITRHEGDVINLNWAQQYNFALDHDIASVAFSGSETWIGTGGNSAVNTLSLTELGLSYDLIFASGDLIDVSLIRQTNVLFDDDLVHLGGGFAGELKTQANLLMNRAEIHDAGTRPTAT